MKCWEETKSNTSSKNEVCHVLHVSYNCTLLETFQKMLNTTNKIIHNHIFKNIIVNYKHVENVYKNILLAMDLNYSSFLDILIHFII